MKKYSILFLNTFFLMSSLHASHPASQVNLATPTYLINNKVLPALVTPRIIQPGKSVWQASQAAAASSTNTEFPALSSSANAASKAGATTITQSLQASNITTPPPAQPNSDNATVEVEKELPPVELNSRELSYFIPAAILNKWNGTDQTLLHYLRTRNHKQRLITNTPEAQQILASTVSNFKKRTDYQEKMNDILEFMTLVKREKVIIDRTSRRTLREFLKEYEDKQEKDLLDAHKQKVEIIKTEYAQQIENMKATEAARHLTYQSDSDNEEEIRVYKPTNDLMRFKTEELVTKVKPAKK